MPAVHDAADRLHDGPLALVPRHREENRLSAHGKVGAVRRSPARCECSSPPFSIAVLEQIRMSHSLEILIRSAVGQMWIVWARAVRASDVPCSCHGDGVIFSCAALGDEKIVPSVLFVNMGTFWPNATGTVPELDHRTHLSSVDVYFLDPDALGGDIDLAIVIPEQIGVNLWRIEEDWITPRGIIERVGSLEQDAIHTVRRRAQVLADHIECTFVMPNSRGVHALLLCIGGVAVSR